MTMYSLIKDDNVFILIKFNYILNLLLSVSTIYTSEIIEEAIKNRQSWKNRHHWVQ